MKILKILVIVAISSILVYAKDISTKLDLLTLTAFQKSEIKKINLKRAEVIKKDTNSKGEKTMRINANFNQKIYAILTKEQKKKLKELNQK